MKELMLDGAGWSTKDDVYNAFFHAVGAPEWHGRNFNALNDSIANGSINKVEVPYTLVLINYDLIYWGCEEDDGRLHRSDSRNCSAWGSG